ncbi:MAG: MGMT family protein [Candidatus Levybacteria bacterium]|nr:MGMT family protein [Candidatus Levybacteria bacterium]
MNTFEHIYTVVATIPEGKVMTYKQVANIVKTTPRVVGFAMAGNKDTGKVPCHRVIDSQGKLRGYGFGGVNVKRKLLEQEHVFFLNEETIDLTKSLYHYT